MPSRTPRRWVGFRLRTALILVAGCAVLVRGGLWFWSPVNRLGVLLRPGIPEYQRRDAATALGRGIPAWEVDRAVDLLIGALDDPAPSVREGASVGLYELGHQSRRAIPRLLRMLRDPDRRARATAAGCLGPITEPGSAGQEAVIPGLVAALADPDIDVRLMAARSLIALDTIPPLAPVLVAAQADPEGSFYPGQAFQLLRQIGWRRSRLVPGFAHALRDPDPAHRAAALRLLIDHADPATVTAALEQAAHAADPTIAAWATARQAELAAGDGTNPAPR